MKKYFLLICYFCLTVAYAEPLSHSFLRPTWHTYIFVSTKMPRANLIALAREAARTKAILVLNGFDEKIGGMSALHRMIAEINTQCCAKQEISWIVHPKLFSQYGIKAAPAFVIARSEESPNSENTVIVYGDMTFANALKYIAQESKFVDLRQRAAEIYSML